MKKKAEKSRLEVSGCGDTTSDVFLCREESKTSEQLANYIHVFFSLKKEKKKKTCLKSVHTGAKSQSQHARHNVSRTERLKQR